MLEHFHFVIQRDQQATAQVFSADLLLDAVAAAVKPRLAPAGKIERGSATSWKDRAGMDGHAADMFSLPR